VALPFTTLIHIHILIYDRVKGGSEAGVIGAAFGQGSLESALDGLEEEEEEEDVCIHIHVHVYANK
jgi:formaldehyde-activating enzyme involved in methanogenesis